METTVFEISNMGSQHCMMTVKQALTEVSRIQDMQLEPRKATIMYEGGKTTKQEIIDVITRAGYNVVQS